MVVPGGACLKTTQPTESCDKCRQNRSQGRRCAAPKPSARCACVQCAVCSVQEHLHTSATRACAPRVRTPLARTSLTTSGVRGNVDARGLPLSSRQVVTVLAVRDATKPNNNQ